MLGSLAPSLNRKFDSELCRRNCDELVQLRGLLFRRRVPGKRGPTLLPWNFRRPISNSICQTTWTRVVVAHSERRVGMGELSRRISLASSRASLDSQSSHASTISRRHYGHQHGSKLSLQAKEGSIGATQSRERRGLY